MLLRFRTDASVTHQGFKAKFSIGRSLSYPDPGWAGRDGVLLPSWVSEDRRDFWTLVSSQPCVEAPT